MNKVKELLTSRKFLAMLGGCLGLIGSAMQGLIGWTEALGGCVGLVMVWLNSQGKVDAAKVGATTPAPNTTNGG
jgi:nicotinamide riboside transporter PnuC